MNRERDSYLVISIAVLLCVFRAIVRNSENLDEIMGLINLFALFYSIWCMFNDAEVLLNQKIEKSSLGNEVFKTSKKNLKRDRQIVEAVVFVVCGIVYIRFVKSATGNDILTIIALCFALEANNFSNKISRFYFKKR